MSIPSGELPGAPSWRRGPLGFCLVLVGIGVCCLLFAAADATAADRGRAPQSLVVLLGPHVAHTDPKPRSQRIEVVLAKRPLTSVPTVLPVLGRASVDSGKWLRVRLPGRPNGHVGWIRENRTRPTSTEWSITVDRSARRVTVFRRGEEVRRFAAIVGSPSTPTPRGRFFVEEGVRLGPAESGAPFALATSARSNVYQEFEGGPGQIALHGTAHLSGALGTASSHGCIRLDTQAITWMAKRIGAGVPLSIVR
jgi:lipoprotein-anchoring transpeptidase ErfK/SrfK